MTYVVEDTDKPESTKSAFAIEAVENIGKAKSFMIVGVSALIIVARFTVFR